MCAVNGCDTAAGPSAAAESFQDDATQKHCEPLCELQRRQESRRHRDVPLRNQRHRVANISLMLVLSVLTAGSAMGAYTDSRHVLAQVRNPAGRDAPYEKMVVDHMSFRVYVGAVDKLYELGSDLSLRKTLDTGPAEDSFECPGRGRCNADKQLMHAHTKALTIDRRESRLVLCTSLYQGRCTLRYLYDIGRSEDVPESAPHVANDADSSSLAFVAPGPPDPNNDMVLVVASTVTQHGKFRDSVPSIASLSIDKKNNRTFQLAGRAIQGTTQLTLSSSYRSGSQAYLIDYVYGFTSGRFSYLVTRQARAPRGGQPYLSKIARICNGDPYYYSYTEVPLVCAGDNIDYNLVYDAFVAKPGYELAQSLGITTEDDVLYAVFSAGDSNSVERNSPTARSALCVYSLKRIDQVFLENIQKCNLGRTPKGLEWFSKTLSCNKVKYNDVEQYICGTDANPKIGGDTPVASTPAVAVSDAMFTAVAATTSHTYTVVFIGTHDGRVRKAVVDAADQGAEYDSISVEPGRPILPDMHMDTAGNASALYVLTKTTLTKLKTHDCTLHTRCTDCLAAADPYCGWCARANQCTARGDCPYESATSGWISYKQDRCTNIVKVDPPEIQITNSEYLRLEIDNLPVYEGAQYSCVFLVGSERFELAATLLEDSVSLTCPTPDRLPPVRLGEHETHAVLSVHANSGPDFATTDFIFFDCSSYSACTACVGSTHACDWCVDTGVCTDDSEDTCRAMNIINGMTRTGPSSRRGPDYCPRMAPVGPVDSYVLAGTTRDLVVRGLNLDMTGADQFQCQVTIEGHVQKRTATVTTAADQHITCPAVDFDYSGEGFRNGSAEAKVSVVWVDKVNNEVRQLDNNMGMRVIMYKCHMLADTCGTCVTLTKSTFECGWCAAQDRCTRRSKCSASPSASDDRRAWLQRDSVCPFPRVTDFHPKKGPIEGGTMLTVIGRNLGRSYDEIKDAVSVQSAKCHPVADLYELSKKIVCIMRSPTSMVAQKGPVVFRLNVPDTADKNGTYWNVTEQTFSFVDVRITGFEPTKGPVSGGTDVTIFGQDFDAGTNVSVTVAGVPCMLISRTETTIKCRTGKSSSEKQGGIILKIDLAERKYPDTHFYYMDDPVIRTVRPEKTTVSGGVLLEVTGERLELIQRPAMYILVNGKKYTGSLCEKTVVGVMQCRTPRLADLPKHVAISAARPLQVDFGFELDGVTSQHNLSTNNKNFRALDVYPDPTLHEFESVRYYRPDDTGLVLKGENINLAAGIQDAAVQIGREWCNISAMVATTITCIPPVERPEPLAPNSAHPEVLVSIGNAEYVLGQFSYDGEHDASLPPVVLIVAAAAVGVFVLALLLLLLVYRRKSTRQTRAMRSLKQQMDTIETKVAAECKEAFAELQTHMHELVADPQHGIPFLIYRDYMGQVLFPNTPNHVVLRELEANPQQAPFIEKTLRLFNQLLLSKTFLLHFVRVMEANKFFLVKDKVYVGSLLMVILQEKMEYCTDILKTLLEELISRTVERRYQPKMLFRRSESVAERMLSVWFTSLMHNYLVECAGQPLYNLFYAIKQQTEKGPQDAITFEARYSLSEEKLLRSSIDFHPMTIYVTCEPAGASGAVGETAVRVLDCDTISQVKEKCLDAIFRISAPYSHRPSANDLDLEWRTGGAGRMALQDLDHTSRTEQGNWKLLNTLAHYNVPNNSSLALVARQSSLYNNLSLLSDKSEKSSTFSLKNSPTLTRAFARDGHKDPESGYKLYHLVKSSDLSGGASNGQADSGGGSKMVSEIYLTRLLTMKGTLQRFIEDLFEAIFSTAHRSCTLPLCIKYMFDFMDEQAARHGISDPEVAHTWKSNALPLRFWVNLIKNPHFMFDIARPVKIDGSLSVVAATLIDACSTQDHQLNKDSPSSKLLFAKDISVYRSWVDIYYQEISSMAPISDQDMTAFLADESRAHQHQNFYVYSALNQLYKYLDQYKDQLYDALDGDEAAKRNRLPEKFNAMLAVAGGHLYGSPQAPAVA